MAGFLMMQSGSRMGSGTGRRGPAWRMLRLTFVFQGRELLRLHSLEFCWDFEAGFLCVGGLGGGINKWRM